MRCPTCQTSVAENARFCGACGGPMAVSGASAGGAALARAPAFVDDTIGTEIAGRYRILSKLGQGGMGAVYRAEQISLKRIIALKLLRDELSENPGIARRFNKEAELAAKLSHPNTVTLFDFGQAADGTLFIAMELVDGTSLRNVILREGALPPARALRIAEQVALSLADAHLHGIVHRDLKPDNVMLRTQGKKRDVVTVLDFGIAKLRDEGDGGVSVPVTRAGDLLGTPQYMAPEQIRAEAVDGRTDVYALGAMLYEMVTGQLPFQGSTVTSILSKHLTEPAVPPEVLKPELDISPGLSGLIMQALEKSPDARPDSMESMAERISALKRVAGGERLSAPTITRPPGVPLSFPGTAPSPPFAGTPAPLSTQQSRAPMAQGHAPVVSPAPVSSAVTPSLVPSLVRAPTPAPAVGHVPTPAPVVAAGRKSRSMLYLAAGAMAAAAVVGAVLLGGGETKTSTSGGQPNAAGAGPDNGGASGPPIFTNHTDVGGLEWRNPRFAYAIILPQGFQEAATGNPANVSFLGGTPDARAAIIAMASTDAAPNVSDAELMEAVKQLAAAYKGVVSQQRFVTIQGKRRLTGVFDAPAENTRSRFVLFKERDLTLMVLYQTGVDTFAGTEAAAAELFEKRVKLLPAP